MKLEAGARIGPYTIVEALGDGGSATVYKAYEPGLDRHIALKVLTRGQGRDPKFVSRFEREARVVAKLEHPGIVPIFAFGVEPKMRAPWMAMRLLPSGTLEDVIADHALDIAETITLVRQVADALDYAHARGVIHRDVKPQNVLLDERGRVYLADFGIARDTEGVSLLTGTGAIQGTPEYISPEQVTGAKVDARADIYSLGVLAYQCMTGGVPFEAPTPVAVLMKHVQDEPPRPSATVVPPPIQEPLMKALAKDAAARHASAGEFAIALEQAHREMTTPPMTASRPRVRSATAPTLRPGRNRAVPLSGPVIWFVAAALVLWILGVAILAAALVFFGPTLLRRTRPATAPKESALPASSVPAYRHVPLPGSPPRHGTRR